MERRKNLIERWVARQSPGSAFSACDLPASLSRDMRDVTLFRLAREGRILRVVRGVYGIPVVSKALGLLAPPGIDAVARAIARKFDWRIMPSDDSAANGLGLSTQVPSRVVYVSDGPTRHYRINGMDVEFRHCCQRETSMRNRDAKMVIRGLKGLGRDYVTPEIVAQIAKRFSDKEWDAICRASTKASGWIYRALWEEKTRRDRKNEK